MLFKFFKKSFVTNSSISSRGLAYGAKSIYKKLSEENVKSEIFEILQYGYPNSRFLRTKIEDPIPIANINKYKGFIESLKMTAAHNNIYSLSSPQVKVSNLIFCMHKDLSEYKWSNSDLTRKLDPDDYEVIVNPRIITASKICHYEYEECASFNILKAKARRPLAIRVAYFNESGKAQEKELFDFEARVFCHEYDHLAGVPFIYWKVSEGDIEVFSEDNYDNLKITIEYYKNRLSDAKINDSSIFEYFETPLVNADHDNFMEEQLQLDYDLKNKKKLSFEDVMLIDIEKGIRKDLKMKLKKSTQKVKPEIVVDN